MYQEAWVQIHQSAKGRHNRDTQTLTCSPQEHLTVAAGLLLPPGSQAASQAQACKGFFQQANGISWILTQILRRTHSYPSL